MLSALRDFLLSFCPEGLRLSFPPESPQRTLRAATWGGLAQFFLASWALFARFKSYFAMRAGQFAPHLGGSSEVVQAGVSVIVVFEYLLHPLSLFLLYLAAEGLARFFAGLATAEALPNLMVFLVFKITQWTARKKEQRQIAALPADLLQLLPDGRVRISSALPRSNWNASITIGLNGQWFEVERAETGLPPHSYIYWLRPAPQGKILRGYEEYDAASALPADPLRS